MEKLCSSFLLFLALTLIAGCGADKAQIPEADDAQAMPDEPQVAPAEALEKADVDLAEIPEERDAATEPPLPVQAATADKKKPEWLRKSPFNGKDACGDWDGESGTITAACCKYVVGNYAAILASPGQIDVVDLMTKDPFLNACKAFNQEFLDAIDQIENPEEEDTGGAPF